MMMMMIKSTSNQFKIDENATMSVLVLDPSDPRGPNDPMILHQSLSGVRLFVCLCVCLFVCLFVKIKVVFEFVRE